MKTVQDAINTFKTTLKQAYDSFETEAITMLVLSDITGYTKAKLKAFGDDELSAQQTSKLETILTKLKTGMPVQYALGHTEFFELNFQVNPAVLIPRPETEELVAWIIETVTDTNLNMLDIGTGSGCIAVALKHELKQAKVSAIDISAEALKTARQNAAHNQCDINFIQADILNPYALKFDYKFDIIVSNPPYVTETDKLQMHSNVTDFEPHTALFVPENDPLLFYNAIADFAIKNLNKGGHLFFEINESYAQQIIELLQNKLFINIELRKDIRGKDRMVKANPLTP